MPRDFKSRPTVNGSQVALATDSGGVVGTYSFAPTDAIERHVVTDANVHSTSKIIGTIRRPTTEEVDDYGWFYKERVVSVQEGSFVLQVTLEALDELADSEILRSVDVVSAFPSFGGVSAVNMGSTAIKRLATPIHFPGGKLLDFSVLLDIGSQQASPLLIEIQTDSTSLPSGTVVATSNIFDGSQTLSSIIASFSFLPPVSLSAGKFWAVIKHNDDNPSGNVRFTIYRKPVTSTPDASASYNATSSTWVSSNDEGLDYSFTYSNPQTMFTETLNYDYIII